VHQIRFQPRLCPRPGWGRLQRSPDPLAGLRGSTCKGGEGKEREKKKVQGNESRNTTQQFLATPLNSINN